jgi:hypothetical protein
MRRAILLAALACAHGPLPPDPRGRSRESAVEVCLPPGEKAFLEAWRCPDGVQPHQHRIGSIGSRNQPIDPNDPRLLLQMDPERPLEKGEPDFHIVDAVEMRCPGATYTLFVDMYHCR